MGDGRIALILDVYNLAKKGNLSLTDRQHQIAHAEEEMEQKMSKVGGATRWLCFRIADDEHFAIAMESVQRIERIKMQDIEHVGGQKVIQKRGRSLPLLSLEDIANIKPMTEKDFAEVITVRIAGYEVGLLATPPVDAVEVALEIDQSALRQDCISGSAIIKGHTTLIVDVDTAVRHRYPDWDFQTAAN